MLVKFAVDPSGLDMTADEAVRKAVAHKRLIKDWQDHGILVWPGERSTILESVRGLPHRIRELWERMLKRDQYANRVVLGAHQLELLMNAEDAACAASVVSVVDLLCAEPTRACVMGLPDDEPAMTLPCGLEVVRIDCTDQARRFEEARRRALQTIERGEDRKQVWDQRFERLAEYSSRITVVDRYALHDLHRNPADNGLRFFLARAVGRARLKKVTIYVSCCSKDWADLDEAVARAREAIEASPRGRAEVQVILARDEEFMRHAHDRTISFDCHTCGLGIGLKVLGRKEVATPCSFALRARVEGDRAVEAALENKRVARLTRARGERQVNVELV